MESQRFDTFTRTIGTRRGALIVLVAGGVAALFGWTATTEVAAVPRETETVR